MCFLVTVSFCLAASFAMPEMPDAEWDDTEVVTNAALPAARSDSRVFAFNFELDATASNNVEVAFGRDAFSALAAHPPRFLYSPEWDTVRVICRGRRAAGPFPKTSRCCAAAITH